MLGGELLGAYCLSEPHSGSDAAALTTKARAATATPTRSTGTKAWITHGGQADFYTVFARTSADRPRHLLPARARRHRRAASRRRRRRRWACAPRRPPRSASTTRGSPRRDRLGDEGQGFPIALSALDGGRLGIAACAVGVAQAALDTAVAYARERRQFGRPIAEFQGLRFMLADMATGVEAARSLYLTAARRRDAGPAVRARRRRWPSCSPPTRRCG